MHNIICTGINVRVVSKILFSQKKKEGNYNKYKENPNLTTIRKSELYSTDGNILRSLQIYIKMCGK